MWNLAFEPPQVVRARVLLPLPDPDAPLWSHADAPGS